MRSRNGALGSLWVMDDVQDHAHTLPQHLSKRTLRRCNAVAPSCRFCCKSLFVQVIANSSSRGCGFRVNMWGTSSSEDKLTGELAHEPDATSISDRGLFCLLAGNLSPGVFRLLQHNLPQPD